MKNKLNNEQKEMLKYIHKMMDELYLEQKKNFEKGLGDGSMKLALSKAVASQESFNLVVGDLLSKNEKDGNACPVILGAALTRMLVNALRPEILPNGEVLCHTDMQSIVNSMMTLAAEPLSMYTWDSFLRNELEHTSFDEAVN